MAINEPQIYKYYITHIYIRPTTKHTHTNN